ncbi:MAG: CpsD/CapB family tyrosine-protein kinase [Deltaproteobacteria bacterium]|nr:CpsD/CapB family tyrosine-protein kinase [Deltaproteobacteria bacterium]
MSDDQRKRPRFEDAATLISEPPVLRPGTGAAPPRVASKFGPGPGAPSTDTAETETRVDGPRGVDEQGQQQQPAYATPIAQPGGPGGGRVVEDGATRLNMKAVAPPPGSRGPSAIPKFYGKGPHELRGEPVATPLDAVTAGPSVMVGPQSHVHVTPGRGAAALPSPPPAGMGGGMGQPPLSLGGAPVPSQQQARAPESGRGNFRIIPVEGTNPDGRLVLVHDADGSPAQQYRLVKFKLKERGDPRAIAVTSARTGEGSTTLAANLALALAEGRRTRVALLEANFRSPALAQAFGIQVASGLTEEIRAHRKDPDAPWSMLELGTGFHLMPCGKPADNPAALLNSEEFARLMQELRLYYDFVIIDTPAVLAAADINIVQDLVDGVVVAARSGKSSGPALRKAVSRLSTKNLTGVVLIGAS